eukprot:Pgem_evm1s9837
MSLKDYLKKLIETFQKAGLTTEYELFQGKIVGAHNSIIRNLEIDIDKQLKSTL